MKALILLFLPIITFGHSAMALIEFKASVTDPVILLVDRTIVSYSYYGEKLVLKAPNFLVQIFIDNSESTYDLVISSINLKIKYAHQSQVLTHTKVVSLQSIVEKKVNSFEPLSFSQFTIPAGERKTLGCDTCYLAVDNLFNGHYPILEEVSIQGLSYTLKGWFEDGGLPVQNATQSVETSNIYY